MKELLNLLKVKTIITIMAMTTLCALTLSYPEDEAYRTAFIGGVSAILAYYFNKKESEETNG